MKIKRLLAFSLSMVMMVSTVPALVFADETDSETTETTIVETSEPNETEEKKPSETEETKAAETEEKETESAESSEESGEATESKEITDRESLLKLMLLKQRMLQPGASLSGVSTNQQVYFLFPVKETCLQ